MTEPRRRVGVLTFHRCINYGSYWQARCLVEGLRAAGLDAVLLDHDSFVVRRAELRCALQPHLPERSLPEDLSRYAAKTRGFLAAVRALPLSARFDIAQPDFEESYDSIVVGSDEVWNLGHPWYGGMPLFYGDGLHARRLVAYAASFGNQSAAHGLPQYWAGRLRRFSAISVRDANSARLVGEALDAEPELVLDPCLQFPEAVPTESDETTEPYLAIYGHSFPGWFAQATQRAARTLGLRLVSVGYRNGWADEQRIVTTPEGFAGIMAGAAAVATNFFHGCVFALRFGKPFACVPSDYRANKVLGLVDMLGARRHLTAEDRSGLAGLLAEPPEPAVFQRIAALRVRSSAYLATALG